MNEDGFAGDDLVGRVRRVAEAGLIVQAVQFSFEVANIFENASSKIITLYTASMRFDLHGLVLDLDSKDEHVRKSFAQTFGSLYPSGDEDTQDTLRFRLELTQDVAPP